VIMLSIIIPTYKRKEKLQRCLGSIPLAAANIEYETIVVDDCPEGSAFPVAQEYGAKYIFKAGVGRGQSISRNMGIKMSQGDWISFIDDDDFFVEKGLENLLLSVEADSTIVYSDYYLFDENLNEVLLRDNSNLTVDEFLIRNRMAIGSYIINKSKLIKHFDEQLKSHEDWDFLLPHVINGKLTYVNEKSVYIDKTENSTTSINGRRKQFFWMEYIGIYGKYPAPHLAEERSKMLEMLGIKINSSMLKHEISN